MMIFVLFLGSTFHLTAQTLEKAQHYHTWFSLTSKMNLKNDWSINGLAHIRRHQMLVDWQQTYLQVAVSKKIQPNLSVAAGVGWVRFLPYGDFKAKYAFNEFRIWEQFSHQFKIGKSTIQNRFRWEHRYLERKNVTQTDVYSFERFMYKNRIRHRLLWKRPLGKISLSVSNELFLDTGEITFNHISQNRFITSFGKKISDNLRGSLGYMHQMIWKGKDRNKLEYNHTLLVGLNFLIKKK